MDTIKLHDWLERRNRIKNIPPSAAIARPSPTFIMTPVSDATNPSCLRCLKFKGNSNRTRSWCYWGKGIEINIINNKLLKTMNTQRKKRFN